jgi:hypothetical protein
MSRSNLTAALALAAAGLPVFPVLVSHNQRTGKWDKKPLSSGWQEKATSDEAAVRAFWRQYPEALPGLALGRAGLVVLDADRHGGPDGVHAFQDLVTRYGLPAGAVKVNTAGSGEHWVFRNCPEDPLGNGEGVLPGGINMRGRGGFIVAPGAVRPDGARWTEADRGPTLIEAYRAGSLPIIPNWLVQMIRPHRSDSSDKGGGSADASRGPPGEREQAYAEVALRNVGARVASTPPGSRNNALFKAAAQLGSMVAAGWIDHEQVRERLFAAAQDCGLVRDDGAHAARATIENGLEAGMAEPHAPLTDREGSFGTNGTFGTQDESAWSDPDLSYLGSGRSKPVPFPVDLLDPFWGDWVQAHASARSAPVDYVAAGLLTGAAALIGNARWALASPEWKEPPILWTAVVGAPGASKSPALEPALELLRRIEFDAMEASRPARETYEEEAKLAEAKAAEWERQVREALQDRKDPPERPTDAVEPQPVPLPRLVVGDTTPERLGGILQDNPKGLLMSRDELAGWLASFGRYSQSAGGERAMWIEAYGGRPYTIDRQKHPEPTIIPRLTMSVLGGIQPDKLPSVTGGADDGFASRFLWFWPDPVLGFRLHRKPIDSTQPLLALRRLHGLSLRSDEDGKLQPVYVPLSEAAGALLENYANEARRQALEATGPLAGVLSKAPGYALRLALVLEYLAWAGSMQFEEPRSIGESTLEAAIGLIDGYFLPMAQRVLGEAAIPEEDQRAMVLARWIMRERPRRFNARQIRRGIGGVLRDSKSMNQACEVLTQAGWIRPITKPTGGAGGRSPSDYEVNPILFSEARAA